MTMAARVTSIGNGEQTAIRKQWLDNGGQQLRTDQKRHTTKSTSHAGVVTHTCTSAGFTAGCGGSQSLVYNFAWIVCTLHSWVTPAKLHPITYRAENRLNEDNT